MDSRERTMRALAHEETDRLPVDCWLSHGTRDKLRRIRGQSPEQFLDLRDVDLRYIEGPRYVGPPLDGGADAERDVWGVPRQLVTVRLRDGTGEFSEAYREVLASPLEACGSAEEILDYTNWPSPDWYDYSGIEAQCDRIRDAGRVVVFMGDRLNRLAQLKPAMYLRGAERIYLDLAESPEIVDAIFGRITAFYLAYGERILDAARGKIDILCTGDDFGGQSGPLISPSAWRRHVRPGFQALVALGKSRGIPVMHHTCGSVRALIPDLIDSGLDILQALQPEAAGMEPRALKRDFGRRLCFQGGISIQSVLPRGTPHEVRQHVLAVLEALAPGGGYIACTSHNIQADTPLANIDAVFAAYREYGVS